MEKQGTKLCKHCKTEIPAGAKICPNCRKKQSGKLKWAVIFIITILIIGIAAGGNDDKPKRAGTSGTEDGEIKFKKGETAELNGVQVTLTNYAESNGQSYNKPESGNVFFLAEFEIVNNKEEEITVSSLMSFEAYADDYKLDYSFPAMIAKEGKQLDGTIAAGKKMKGWIGWEIPKDCQSMEIRFTDNVWSSNKFVFIIEKKK